ncbi:hypothetical protein H9N28_12170 [Rhodobacter capsulatus]|uniref:Uncharacterized protein n=1 Tax=Rhodobacter capsulatus TaxID=1061 RepID=A0A0Q0W8P3_RHOCA|nr:hypothetical protein [Rhodobacter capsulatus]KQB11799.1 hypothetical protein AP073_07395 [Rhodobacter capsulatus]KQB11918.1 hypothetical protein AP071_08130 [Rhodobacter capsulatus]PZX23725.1 hypothetical protein LY44_02352 [Rhodobacter capsulatus]QNR62325.1 hypothetical protein H9N28_12170 [Rhodobacter capsulatus]WER08321.1 hypothetical protein PUH89_13465 [Rhodobacter capsulatus]
MIPDLSDPRWKRVLTGTSDLSSASLATRILISRLRREVAEAPAALAGKIGELRDFVAKNPFALADAAKF